MDNPPPDALRRPIKAYWLSQSLGLPRETVGRKVRALVAERRLISTDQGLVAPAAAFEQEELKAQFLVNSALLAGFCARLAKAGIEDVPLFGGDPSDPAFPHRVLNRIGAAFFLRAMDQIHQVLSGEFLTGLVLCGIVDANTCYISDLPGQPYANLEDPEPDAMRRPITALALADKLGLPRETARRHVRILKQLGMCNTVRGGLVEGGLVAGQASPHGGALAAAAVRNHISIQVMLKQLRVLARATAGRASEPRRPPARIIVSG